MFKLIQATKFSFNEFKANEWIVAVNSSVYYTHTHSLLINTPRHPNKTEPCKRINKDKNTNIKPQSKVITKSEKLVMLLLNCKSHNFYKLKENISLL